MIEQTIRRVMSTIPAKCDEGWWYDAEHFFCEHKSWKKAAAFIRTDPSCLLELKGIACEDIESLRDLRTIQQSIWQELAWSHYQASSVTFYRQASVLRFITVVRDESSCLTGRMIIGGNHYYELVRRWNGPIEEFPESKFDIDFVDVDESILSLQQAEIAEAASNRKDDDAAIAEIAEILSRIENYTLTNKEKFLESDLLRDAVMFNLSQLLGPTGNLSRRFPQFREWRERLPKALSPRSSRFGEARVIWGTITQDLRELARLVKDYNSGPTDA